MLIDRRRRDNPSITKLGTDMSVPDGHLMRVMRMYREMLMERGLQSAIWGHIGANHLHVNILPRDGKDFLAGKELYALWAAEVTRLGGAVSAEHGVGKIKADFLKVMYGERHIAEMRALKLALHPGGKLGMGNLFAARREAEGK
jgi:D-lactate dehydrogenase (cytochrome)